MKLRDVSELFRAALGEQLRQITSERVTIRYVEPLQHDSERRERFREIYQRRLRYGEDKTPACGYTQALRSALDALEKTGPDEQFFSWSVKTSEGFMSGISTAQRAILVLNSDNEHNPII